MSLSVNANRNWGRWLASLFFLLLWLPGISHGVTVQKFVAAQAYGLSVRGYYEDYNMAANGVISSGGGVPQIHVFPNNPVHVANYNSIAGKYVVRGTEKGADGMGAYDPNNDPSITNSFRLGPKVPLGFSPEQRATFFRTISVIPAPEITVKNHASQQVVSGGVVQVGSTEIGTERTFSFQIINTGSVPLTGIVVSIVEPHEFTVTQPAVTTLASGASTTFIIKFRPIGAGNRAGWLRIASNDADENPFALTLSGVGTGVVARSIQILNNSGVPLANGSGVQSFGGSTVQTTVTRSLTIRNAGNVPLSNIALSLKGTNASDFSVEALPSSTLAVAATMALKIHFTPSATGTRSATISVASNDITNNPYTFQITGSATIPVTFDSWLQGTTLAGGDAEPEATPFGDGVSNLLKYAFNLDPNGPDSRQLTPVTGTAGLPVVAVTQPGPDFAVRIEFLRRKNSDLIYTPKRSYTLSPASFTAIIMPPPIVTAIDGEWERVVVNATEQAGTKPTGFYIVEVTKADP